MKITKTNIEDLLILEPDIFYDNRGFFFESFNEKKYREIGIDKNFVQDNISKSSKGTVRGLHYQIGEFAQGKLCQIIRGKVLDIAVDIRIGSPTFGQHFAVELSEENKKQFWIPEGFAHGFSVLSEEAIFLYKCTSFYSKKDERAILYSDKELNINWKVKNPIVSEKDLLSPSFSKMGKNFIYKKTETK